MRDRQGSVVVTETRLRMLIRARLQKLLEAEQSSSSKPPEEGGSEYSQSSGQSSDDTQYIGTGEMPSTEDPCHTAGATVSSLHSQIENLPKPGADDYSSVTAADLQRQLQDAMANQAEKCSR